MSFLADKTFSTSFVGSVAAATNSTGINTTMAVGQVAIHASVASNQANTVALTLQHSATLGGTYTNVAGVAFGPASNVANTSQTAFVNKRELQNFVRVNIVPGASVTASGSILVVHLPRTA